MRSLAASFRGFYLRTWRYGPETEQLVLETLERDHWPNDKWKHWQQERLAYVLHRAATRVPYYRNHWESSRQSGNRASWERLENWPILDKQHLQANPLAFIADDCDKRDMFPEHTSGTTGKPLEIFWSRNTVRVFYTLFEARWRRWYGVTRQDRWAILGGQLVTPVNQRKPPFWVWNAPMKQLYMSSYHLSPAFIPYYLEALKYYSVKYIFGYSSSLYAIAQEILRLGRSDLRLHVAITNAEPVFDYQRQIIEQAFNCPVRETYGNSEIVASASECDARQLHLWPELGWVEVLGTPDRLDGDIVGDLVCTSLLNTDMPLIRYRIGDRASIPNSWEPCSCGRTLPLLRSVDGRLDDVLHTPDGRVIGRLDPIFKTQMPIREAQIIQETLNRVRVRYVPTAAFDNISAELITKRLRERMGSVEVVLEPLTDIPREKNGKFRSVKCNLSPDEKQILNRSVSTIAADGRSQR